MASEQELNRLIGQFKAGDLPAFERLHQLYATNICGVVCTIVRDRLRAEELTQDVFVKIWHARGSYDSRKGRFFTWVLNIARNAAIDELRSKTHKEQQLNLHTDYFVDIPEQDDAAGFGVSLKRVRNLVSGLSKKCRQLIDLLYFKGLTQKESAQYLDIPLGTVKTRNRNCIMQLRKNISDG